MGGYGMNKHVKLTAPGRIEMTRALPGTLEKVWSYIIESDLRQKWFCAGEIEPREGGKIVFDFDHTRIFFQRVINIDKTYVLFCL